jgi:hypothetical protein
MFAQIPIPANNIFHQAISLLQKKNYHYHKQPGDAKCTDDRLLSQQLKKGGVMKAQVKFFFTILMAFIAPIAIISCSQTSKTQYMPAGGGSPVSRSAELLNGLTEALNDMSVSYSFDNSGNGLAIWFSQTGYGDRYLYAVYNPGKKEWSRPEEFYRNTSRPNLASNGAGIMATFSYNGNIYARTRSSGGFGDPVGINDASGADLPTIVSDGTNYCIAWRQYDTANGRYDVYASRSNGASWSAPVALDSTAQTPNNIEVVSGGSGYCVTWYEQTTDRTFASVYIGSWSAAQNIGNAFPTSTYRVDGNDAGTYVIAFDDSSNGFNSIFARVFNGSWSGVTELDIGAWNAYSPRVASNGTTFWVVWSQYNGSNTNIYGTEYTGSWGITQAIDTADGPAFEPVIASDGSGYCATWYQYDAGTYKTTAALYTPSTWQAASILSTSSTSSASGQLVSSNGAGYMIAWVEDDSGAPPESRYSIHSCSYSAGAWSVPSLIQSNSYTMYNNLLQPFTGGYGLAYSYYTAAFPGLMANVFRNGEWSGSKDIVAGQRHGSCSRQSDIPVLYRAGQDTVAVYRQYESVNGSGMQKIFARVKTGSSWGAIQLISDQTNYSHYVASNGSAVCIVWTGWVSATSRNAMQAKIYSNGAWGNTVIVDTDTNGYYSYDALVAGNASTNDFCVIFRQYDGSYYRTYANLHTSTGWAGPVQIDNTGMSANSQPYLVVAGTTGYCALFDQNSQIYGTVYKGSSWTTPEQLHTTGFSVSRFTMAGSGDHYAVSADLSGNVYTNVYDGTGWSGMEVQDLVPSTYAYASTLTGDGSGGFCLAWYENGASGYYNIMARLYDGSSLSWGDGEDTEVHGFMDQDYYSYSPRIASNGTGYAVVFRKQDMYGSFSLYASVNDGSGWLGADLLENAIADVESPYYDINSNGTGYSVVWQQYDAAMNLMAYRSVYDRGTWDGGPLSNGEGNVQNVEVLGTGNSYTAAWYQVDAIDNLVLNIWTNTFK